MKRSFLWRAAAKVSIKLPLYNVVPPYDYIQNIIERNLHYYIDRDRTQVKSICIVGGYYGYEIPRLLRSYPSCSITVFEPSRRYAEALGKRYSDHRRVRVKKAAVSSAVGAATFYETSLRGSGSLLPLGRLAKESYGAVPAESFTVPTVTLDSEIEGELDCLWIDVQGAELKVLEGARGVLPYTRSLFLEVSRVGELYEGGAIQSEIEAMLRAYGLEIALLGLDKHNLTGNAFFINTKHLNRAKHEEEPVEQARRGGSRG